MGVIEKALRGAGSVSVENRADGSHWVANFARAGAVVLSTQRDDDAFGVYAQY